MRISFRGWIALGTLAAALAAILAYSDQWLQAAEGPAQSEGRLTHDSLGALLQAMGLSPKRVEQRYDFDFKAIHGDQEWQLSMSTVLSRNEDTVWVMAWLDELPRSAADVPRTALLRLLAHNDRLGNGKFFAYVSSNRRFVLQRVVANSGMSTAAFHDILEDLGVAVVTTHSNWSVANWRQGGSESQTSEEPPVDENAAAGPQLKAESSGDTSQPASRVQESNAKGPVLR